MNRNHQKYSGYTSGTPGGAAVARLPPKLGLYTIAEKEEEYLDDADGNQDKLKMSGTPSQKSMDGGVPSPQRVSSLQNSNKSGALYGSVPDMSSASFQKSEETEPVTESEFKMQPLMTSTPRHSLEQLAHTDVYTELNREVDNMVTDGMKNPSSIRHAVVGEEPSAIFEHVLDQVVQNPTGQSFVQHKVSKDGTSQSYTNNDINSGDIKTSNSAVSDIETKPFSSISAPVSDTFSSSMCDKSNLEDVINIKSNLQAAERDGKAVDSLSSDSVNDERVIKHEEISSPQEYQDEKPQWRGTLAAESKSQSIKLPAVAHSKPLGRSATGPEDLLKKKQKEKLLMSLESFVKGKHSQPKSVQSDFVSYKEKDNISERSIQNTQHKSDSYIPSMLNKRSAASKTCFNFDDIPVELRPYISMDFDPAFMDDPECREDVYEMARQKMKAKEREQKAAKLADDITARSGLPKSSLCPLGVKDSFDGGLSAADILKRKQDPVIQMDSSKKGLPTSTFALSATSGISNLARKESNDQTVTKEKGSENEKKRSVGLKPSDLLKKKLKSEVKQAMLREESSQQQSEIISPSGHTGPNDKQGSLVGNFHTESVTQQAHPNQASIAKRSEGYGEADFNNPTELLKHLEIAERSPGYVQILYTTPSDRRVNEKSSKSPGYGNLDYTTPSVLLKMTSDRDDVEGNSKSPGYESIDYTTPSKLLRKATDRDIGEESSKSPGYGSIDYTTPSQLDQNKESVDKPQEYTTPSKLLRKITDRRIGEESSKSPGYGSIDYTTPSQLVQSEESVDKPMEYTTPSELLRKITDRRIGEESSKSPGYGSIDYTTPSQLVQNEESVDKPMEYTTPSELLRKITDRRIGEESSKSPGYGSIDYTTPYQLVHMDCNGKQLEYSSPFRLLQKTPDGYTTDESEKSPGYGEYIYTTPSQLGQSEKDSDMTPSKILWNGAAREIMEQIPKSPENVAAPSELLKEVKEGDDVKEISKAQGYGEHIYSTSLELLQKIVKQEVRKQYREHLGNWKTTDTEPYSGSYDSESVLKSRASSMSTAYPLSDPSSYQRSLLSGKQESSISLIRNPSFLCDSSSEESGDEESMIDSERISEKKVEEGIVSGYGSFPSDTTIRSGDLCTKLPQQPEAIPDSVQSLNERFWNLCMSSPGIRRFIHENENNLFPDTSPEPDTSSLKSLEHCTNSPECTCMQCTSKTSIATQRESKSAFGRSHVTAKQSSRLPIRQKRLSEDGISGQKKKTLPNVRSTTPEARGFIMEKEMVESQNRKLQMEVSTLQTENKLLKDKNNRCQAKINDLEEQLTETKEALESLHTHLTQELSEASRKIKTEAAQEIERLQNRITSVTEENDSMKYEVTMLEKQLDSAHKVSDKAWQNSEKNKTLDAYKMEVVTLKDEVIRVKSLLEQSERHLQEEEQRSRESSQSLLQLTEVKNLLQQQLDMGGGGVTAVDKQIKSLEKRLRVTEERLHQERADRANNLSEVEDKLLTENARLQAVEKELNRQLQREKDKNRNLDHKVKDVREENEKLRLSLPFDESALISQKTKYDIPYGVHSSQRTETVKNTDYKHVINQVEQETGQKLGQEKDIVCYLWNTREETYHQLQQQAIILQDLNFGDNITEGLKNLRDVKSQSDAKVQQLEEKLNDLRSEKATFEVTYKEQLTALVKERHDAFARLKTAEDLMEAIRSENEILKSGLLGQTPESLSASTNLTQTGQLESLHTEMMEAERKNQQLMRSNILLEGEISTLKVQLDARDKALEEAQNEADLARKRLVNDEEADRKQQKIDKLTSQVSNLQAEVKLMTDKFSALLTEKNKLENDLVTAHRELSVTKVKVRENKVGEMADNKQNQILKEEIGERDRRYSKLSQECDHLESQLQQVRQDLYAEQIQTQEYESQLEGYQQQLEQRGQMVDTLSGTEKEQLAQFQILKDTMDSVSQELSQKQAQNKVLQLELSKEKDKYEYMERELNNLRQDRKEGKEDRPLPSHQLQIRELEKERDHLKSELLQASKSLEQAAERHTAAENEIKQLQQEVATEKGTALQISTEKGELEQNLEEIAEEHDALVQEKAQNEEDIVKLEQKLEEVIHKLEMEFRKHTENFTAKYQNVPPEAVQMVEEIESLRSLLDTKAAEEDTLKHRISRQQVEMDFLQRRVELLHNENECNRDDIMRMTGEVITKMKEGVAVREMNQFLVKERDRLLKDNAQLENSNEKERGDRDRRKAEIADVIRKVEKSEDTSKMTSRDLLQKDAIIASLESELQEVKRTLRQQETENSQLKGKSEHLSKDIQNLSSINTSLENRLDAERSVLEEEKSQSTRRRDELMSTNHELELLKHDHHINLNTLNAEKQTVEVLKENVADLEEERHKLKEEVHTLTMELESYRGQLTASKETVDNLKQDKGAIYHEYDSMVRRLHEKDEKIEELQAKCDKTMETMQKELTLQKHSLEKEKTSTEHDLEMSREEITSLNEEMKQKEAQLNSFGRTLQELEETTRQKRELEVCLEKMESSHSDSSLLLESMRKETMSLQETIARQQEALTQAQGEKVMLQDQLKIEKEKLSGQVLVLNKENTELRSQTEGEKSYLKDSLVSTQLRLSSVEASLSSVTEARDKAQINNRMLERSLEEAKDQYQAETTSRKVAEQRAESLQSQLNETRKDRFLAEEKLGQAQSSLTKVEKELRIEKDRVKRLNDQTQELEATSFGHESSSQAKQDQIALLQDCEIDVDSLELLESLNSSEVGKLRQILESQKQQLNSKLKKTTLDMKQQIEILEEDRTKLTQQNQSLMSDLDRSREQVAVKNKENLKLQERILSLEEEMREQNSKLKQATDAVKAEEEMQAKLTSRYHAQEEELQKMKIYLSKKAEESGGADKSMWVDLNRLVQDMSRQLHEHMEMQTSRVGEQKDQESLTIKKYRKQLQDIESELNTEKALHNITKNSLQALEEDCQRLRHQLHAMRRRDNTSSDKKYKNRMEAINEIIARSQAQAQAMLAASGYYDDTGIKSAMNSPRVDFHGSPDNSVASDISFNSTGPVVIPPYQGTPSPPKFVSSPRK